VATDAHGRFEISTVPAGDTARPAIMHERSAAELPAVTIVEHKASSRLREFDERRARGDGEFFTQAQIEARNAVSTVDILRQAKGLRVTAGQNYSR